MDDLAGKLNELLNDPKTMQQVSALAGMLNANPPQSAPKQESPPQNSGGTGLANPAALNALAGLLGQQSNAPTPPPQQNQELMQTVLQIVPMLNSFQQEDDGTRLLRSLRPLLSAERQRKLDEATKIMKVFRLLPLLKSKGML
ncbi:MAG: hypothetical protein PUC32_04240 [Oscillospiraceae bacterium]|nr:hypothetical protein [Oscillospiraceae bacterium]